MTLWWARARRRVRVGRGVRVEVARGARLIIGAQVVIGDFTRIQVRAGEVRIGARARLGDRCVVVAHERIEIGADAILGDEVALMDFEHDTRDVERPTRAQPLLTAPVQVGEGAIIGAGAALLPGATVAPQARVGVRTVVR